MAAPTLRLRWFRVTPGRVVVALLVVECLLWLSEQFRWLPWHKGYAVLTAMAVVGAALLGMILWFAVAWVVRWRFQFSIRTLLLLTISVAIPCSWLATTMKKATAQRDAVVTLLSLKELRPVIAYDCVGDYRREPELAVPTWIVDWLGTDFFANVNTVMFTIPRPVPLPLGQEREPEIQPDDTIFSCIQHLPHLKEIGSWRFNAFGDDRLKHLKGLKELTRLSLSGNAVTDEGLKELQELVYLEELDLSYTKVTDAGLKYLKGLTRLETLNLDHTQVEGVGLQYLGKLPRLQVLGLSDTPITDRGMRHLRTFSSLRRLYLSYTPITDAGLESLAGLTGLDALDLSQTAVTDAGLPNLRGLVQLEYLSLDKDYITDAGLKSLTGLSRLKTLEVENAFITQAGLEQLRALPCLESLHIGSIQITEEALGHLREVLPNCKITR